MYIWKVSRCIFFTEVICMSETNNENNDTKQKEQEQQNKDKRKSSEYQNISENNNIRQKEQEDARKLSEEMSSLPKPIQKGKKTKWPALKDMQDALNMLGFSIYTSLKKDKITSDTLEKCKNRLFKELLTYTKFVEHTKKWTDLSTNLKKSIVANGNNSPHSALEILSKFSIDKNGKFYIDGKKNKGLWSKDLQECVKIMFQIYDTDKQTDNGFFAGLMKN